MEQIQQPPESSLTTVYPFLVEKWEDADRGLLKEIINYKFLSLTKATEISKCCVSITGVTGLKDHHESAHLCSGDKFEYWVTLGEALTPIDCYIDVFLKQMLVGETSNCSIRTKSGDTITFLIKVMKIEFGGYVFELHYDKIVILAQKYKENGVKMFKKYPIFAQEYFNRAAKLLISLMPFDTVEKRDPDKDKFDAFEVQTLLENLYMNIAACLIKHSRYEDALHVLQFTERIENVPEKALYRRAMAHFKYGQLDDAKKIIERTNYKENKECLALYNDVLVKWKASNQNYSKIVKKMFG